jgi:hypothetical protein
MAGREIERDRLHGYIANSRRVQRRLAIATVVLAAIGVAVLIADRMAGGLVLLLTAIVGVSGFWVTAAHIADWRLRLRSMDAPASPRRAGARRA